MEALGEPEIDERTACHIGGQLTKPACEQTSSTTGHRALDYIDRIGCRDRRAASFDASHGDSRLDHYVSDSGSCSLAKPLRVQKSHVLVIDIARERCCVRSFIAIARFDWSIRPFMSDILPY